jgi:uncharacterized protein YcbK (DUF882 family)
MHRRVLLGGTAAAVLPLPAAARVISPRRLSLRHAATGARFDGIWHNGLAPDPVAMAELSRVLADSAAIRPLPFDPEAVEVLWRVAERARLGPEIVVRSGYRTPEINRAVHGAGDSQHLRAGALDVETGRARYAAVAEAALRLGAGGVGLYPHRGFIHLDSGPVRNWTDDGVTVTASGRRAAPARPDPIARIAEAWASSGGR